MSGGVDSSVAAILLLEAGYEVVGITCQIWLNESCNITASKSCCSNEAIEDARVVCEKLNIKHYVFNYRDLFKDKVINEFCDSYLRGETPNPCMNCNKYIRSEDLLNKTLGMGFDYLATGHYVRKIYNEDSQDYSLKVGLDGGKDQSYFLYQMNQEQMSHMLFPLGEYKKEKIREIALKHGLLVHDKKDSQDICFVNGQYYGDFIEEYLNKNIPKAQIYHEDGTYFGEGKPYISYTIGQRKGLGIAYETPLYVLDILGDEHKIIVGDVSKLVNKSLKCKDIFIHPKGGLIDGREVFCKVRYGSKMVKGIFKNIKDGFTIDFLEKVEAITRGQSCVIYDMDKETLLGGGIIYERGF